MNSARPLAWIESSRKDLLALPPAAVDELGYGIFLAQIGRRHPTGKVLRGIGDACVLELFTSRSGATHCTVYTVRFAQAVFVLHVFQEKAGGGATPRPHLDLVATRLWRAAELARERKW